MNRKSCLALIVLCICILAFTIGCSTKTSPIKPLKKSNYLLGTVVDITLYDSDNVEIIDKAFDRIREIEEKMSINVDNTSEIIELNEASGSHGVKLSPDTFSVLERGKFFSELSKGKFDITIAPIVKLWNIGSEYAAVPESEELKDAMELVNYQELELDKDSLKARLKTRGMKVDLGAIAKGYAADEVARVLSEHGVEHAIINLGGNIIVMGENPKGTPWKIGVQDPFSSRGGYMGVVSARDKTIVTSGIYERYLEQDGEVYHHILDPETGYPAETGLAAVSIITDNSMDADGFSTTLFLLGLNKGMELVKDYPEVEAIFITMDKKVYITEKLKDNFEIIDGEYVLGRTKS